MHSIARSLSFCYAQINLWGRKWQHAPVFWPGESMDRGAWRATSGHTQLDTAEQLSKQTQPENLNCRTLIACRCVCVWESLSCVRVLRPYCPWGFQARILEWVAIFLLPGIFLSQEWKLRLLCLLHWQEDSLPTGCLWVDQINTQMLIIYNTGKYEIISLYKFFFAVWYLWILNSEGVISQSVSWYFVICKLWLYYLKKIQYLEIII